MQAWYMAVTHIVLWSRGGTIHTATWGFNPRFMVSILMMSNDGRRAALCPSRKLYTAHTFLACGYPIYPIVPYFIQL